MYVYCVCTVVTCMYSWQNELLACDSPNPCLRSQPRHRPSSHHHEVSVVLYAHLTMYVQLTLRSPRGQSCLMRWEVSLVLYIQLTVKSPRGQSCLVLCVQLTIKSLRGQCCLVRWEVSLVLYVQLLYGRDVTVNHIHSAAVNVSLLVYCSTSQWFNDAFKLLYA